MKKALNMYRNDYFLTLSDSKLIEFCKEPPKDCEFTELKVAADILADRYQNLYNDTEPQ